MPIVLEVFQKTSTVYVVYVLCPRLNKQKKINNRKGFVSNLLFIIKEGQSGERDHNSGSTIFGKQQMQRQQ